MCLYRRYSPGKPVLTPEQSFQLPPSLQESCSPFAFSVTGTLQVAHRLDRDAGELRQNPTISLEVLVKDRPSGGQENRMQITFIVEDINDNPAACTKTTFRYIHVPGAPPRLRARWAYTLRLLWQEPKNHGQPGHASITETHLSCPISEIGFPFLILFSSLSSFSFFFLVSLLCFCTLAKNKKNIYIYILLSPIACPSLLVKRTMETC